MIAAAAFLFLHLVALALVAWIAKAGVGPVTFDPEDRD